MDLPLLDGADAEAGLGRASESYSSVPSTAAYSDAPRASGAGAPGASAPMVSFDIESYSVGAGKTILRDVRGDARPGEVLAVMGPSGAGKSTLLELMSGRVEAGETVGSVLYDGLPLDRDVARVVGFCPQSDAALVPSLTVEQTFRFAAELTLPEEASDASKRRRVDETLEQLGLLRVRHSRIGGPFQRGLSGGEKRRVSLGTQLIKRPRVLYLDEPTSGLDSFTASHVMADVRRLARELSITVIATLHSPTPHVMRSVDRILLLVRGERVVLGTPSECARFVTEAGRKVHEHENVADVLLDFANPDFDADAVQRVVTLQRLSTGTIGGDDGEPWPPSDVRFRSSTAAQVVPLGALLGLGTAWTSAGHQFRTLLWRYGVMTWRNPLIFWVRFAMTMFMALVIGSLYFGLDRSYESLGDLVSSYFFSMLVTTFVSLTALPQCAAERLVMRHEYTSRMYHLRSYVAALLASRVLVVVAIVSMFAPTVFFMIGVGSSSAAQFLFFWLVLVVANVAAELLMLCVGAVLKDAIAGIAVGVTLYGFSMLMSGTFIVPARMPWFMRPATFASYYSYILQGLMRNSFPHLVFGCPATLRRFVPDFSSCHVRGDDALRDVYGSGSAYFVAGKWEAVFILLGICALLTAAYYRLLRRQLDRGARSVDKEGGVKGE